jgi:hypothetical protein
MNSPDFSHVTLASAFSPRLLAGLAEAWRFSRRFDAQFSVVYCGEHTVEKELMLTQALEEIGIPGNITMEWRRSRWNRLARGGSTDSRI